MKLAVEKAKWRLLGMRLLGARDEKHTDPPSDGELQEPTYWAGKVLILQVWGVPVLSLLQGSHFTCHNLQDMLYLMKLYREISLSHNQSSKRVSYTIDLLQKYKFSFCLPLQNPLLSLPVSTKEEASYQPWLGGF